MPKEIVYSEEFRRRIQAGVDQLANTVKTSLGPKGSNSVIQVASGSPLVTNDGVTIAENINLEDPVENLAVRLIREAIMKTKNEAGDGTSTTTVLAQIILQEGFKNIAAGANIVELKVGIQGAAQLAAAAVSKLAIPLESREVTSQVAATASGDPEIGEIVAEALDTVGRDGNTTVEESASRHTTLDIKKGMQLDVGYLSPEMVTDPEKMAAELENPYILITDLVINDPHDLLSLQEQIAEQGKPLLVIAEGVKGAALGMLLLNKMKGVMNTVVVRPPAYGEGRRARMEDLAILTGGTFITEELGYKLKQTTLDQLGRALSVRVNRKETVIIGGDGDQQALADRKRYLRMLIEKTEYDFDRQNLEERLAKLGGGVAIIKVGAATEAERKEKKQRIEKALEAVKGAIDEGFLPGGGVSYLKVAPALQAYVDSLSGDRRTGAAIVLKALSRPARQIADNAGVEGSTVIMEIERRPPGIGFNALTGEFTDMRKAGILDSAKVTRLALQSAASLASILLTVEVGILDSKD